MANIKSQIKRNKQNEKARQRNKAVKSSLKTAVRSFREAADSGETDKASDAMRAAGWCGAAAQERDASADQPDQ